LKDEKKKKKSSLTVVAEYLTPNFKLLNFILKYQKSFKNNLLAESSWKVVRAALDKTKILVT
jgi:hypothetical protein